MLLDDKVDRGILNMLALKPYCDESSKYLCRLIIYCNANS